MKIKIEAKISDVSIINLEDYGHDENAKWEDLSDEEQREILDPIREEIRYEIGFEVNNLD